MKYTGPVKQNTYNEMLIGISTKQDLSKLVTRSHTFINHSFESIKDASNSSKPINGSHIDQFRNFDLILNCK